MEPKTSNIGTNGEQDFNTVTFEKKLLQLKDSQESINGLSAWCLEHRQHHKKIVQAWLNVLKKVKVEQRLTLFYLANDVIQYSKRKNYDFVASWGTTLQKATPMVREDRVKHKILRIFKIWEQRTIYSEDFIADLSGLLSASTIPQKPDASQEFQPNYLITRIRSCVKLEENTDLKLKQLKDGSPKITDIDSLMTQLKDRRHVEDVEREVEEGIMLIEGYVNALKSEIKSRTHLISVLTQADTFYHTERGEVKVVANAYRNFSTRVKNLKKKLDELIPTLNSPIPSPDINAPSPEPDSDIELPNNDIQNSTNLNSLYNLSNEENLYPHTEQYTAGYYNPVQESQSTFQTNTFSSFMNSTSVPFNIQNLYSDSRSNDGYNTKTDTSVPPPEPVKAPYDIGVGYRGPPQPLQPPPMPPFTSSYMDVPYNTYNSNTTTDSYANSANYDPISTNNYAVSTQIQSGYIPTADAYNPEEELETWEGENSWDRPGVDLETPESPPIFEKESYSNPIEYDDSKLELGGILGGKDVDHRVLMPPPIPPQLSDHRLPRSNSKDVDHRNLISLTGSPGNDSSNSSILQPPPAPPDLWTGSDQDYRHPLRDQDYRLSTTPPGLLVNKKDKSPLVQIKPVDGPLPGRKNSPHIVDIAQQLQLPPPPPPPPPNRISPNKLKKPSFHDNNESIDMDLSDDESPMDGPLHLNGPLMNPLECAPISAGKIENGPPFNMGPVPPPMVPPMGWNEPEWFNGRPTGPPPNHDMRFPHPANMGGGKFRGGFRGRGGPDHQFQRGRGRGGFRGQNNWPHNNRGFPRGGPRGFRPPMPHFGRAGNF